MTSLAILIGLTQLSRLSLSLRAPSSLLSRANFSPLDAELTLWTAYLPLASVLLLPNQLSDIPLETSDLLIETLWKTVEAPKLLCVSFQPNQSSKALANPACRSGIQMFRSAAHTRHPPYPATKSSWQTPFVSYRTAHPS